MLLALPRPGPWHMFGFGGVEMAGKMWLFALTEHKMEVDESMKAKVWDFLSVWWSSMMIMNTNSALGWLTLCVWERISHRYSDSKVERVTEGKGRKRKSKEKRY